MPAPVPGRLADGVGDERGRLRHVEPQPAGAPGPGQLGRGEDQQPVLFRRGETCMARILPFVRSAEGGRHGQ